MKKAMYKILTVTLAAFAITACGDKADLKADATAIENIAEKSDNIKNVQMLLTQISTQTNAQDRVETAKKIVGEATALKTAISGLKLTSDQGKALQAKFEKSFGQLTELANQLVQYATTSATEQQQADFAKLSAEVIGGLQQGLQELQQLKAGAEQAK